MKVDGQHYRSIWFNHDRGVTEIIDQRWLPHRFETQPLNTLDGFADAIRQMRVRGAPLIGVTAAYGVALAMRLDPSDAALDRVWEDLNKTRPTAVNLS